MTVENSDISKHAEQISTMDCNSGTKMAPKITESGSGNPDFSSNKDEPQHLNGITPNDTNANLNDNFNEISNEATNKTPPINNGPNDNKTDENRQEIIPDRIFVGNLPYEVTEDDVRNLTPEFDVISVEIPRKHFFDRSLNNYVLQSKGYGFITYTNVEDAKLAIESIVGKEIKGREIYAKYALPQHKNKFNNHSGFPGKRDGHFEMSFNHPNIVKYKGLHPYQFMNNTMAVPHLPPSEFRNMVSPLQSSSHPATHHQPGPPVYFQPNPNFYPTYIPVSAPQQHPPQKQVLTSATSNESLSSANTEATTSSANSSLDLSAGTFVPDPEAPPFFPVTKQFFPYNNYSNNNSHRYNNSKTKEEKKRKLENGIPSKNTIFIGNLDRDISTEDLHEFLLSKNPESRIVSMKIPKKPLPSEVYKNLKEKGARIQNKGIAFIKFEDETNQKLAIESLNGVEFLNKKLNVTVAINVDDDVRIGKEIPEGSGMSKNGQDTQLDEDDDDEVEIEIS